MTLQTTPMTISTRSTPRGTSVALAGIADLNSLPAMRDALMDASKQAISETPCRGLTVDLSRVDYIDSAGLSVLVAAAKALTPASGELRVLVAAGGQPDRVLRLVRFDAIMKVIVQH